MLPFEKDICLHFEKNDVPYQFVGLGHMLLSDKVNIRFMSLGPYAQDIAEVSELQQFVHLWEDIYNLKKSLVLARIDSLLGINKRIHGRQTRISQLDKPHYTSFLEEHHLMGATQAKYRFGLFFADELVAVAGFGRECPIDHQGISYRSSELIRFCNKTGYTVVGGLSRLVNYFVKQQKVEHLMTYVDREWSEGKTYLKLGFELIGTTKPQQFYLSPEDGKRYRATELKSMGRDYSDWPKLTNLGNNKYIKLFTQPAE